MCVCIYIYIYIHSIYQQIAARPLPTLSGGAEGTTLHV